MEMKPDVWFCPMMDLDPRNIDIPSFLAWAQFCDQLVSDGKGGQEKRATFNHVFDEARPADDQLEIFCQGSGAMLVRQGGIWRVILIQATLPLQARCRR
jgi:predicted phage tail protein